MLMKTLNLSGAALCAALGLALLPAAQVNRRSALAATPALIKAYLRLGGFVGDGAWIDRAFNTTDVCLIMDTVKMSEKHRAFYSRKAANEG